ncbi:MAG: sodium:proton antiporter [Thermoprotei archaeon]|nr:MAG: sodium:proton antiporter [Thermoprotei archaeon]
MRWFIALVIALTAVVFVKAVVDGCLGYILTTDVRSIAEFYLRSTYNVFNKTYWAASPEAVNAILWDYRGLDTVYETTVLFIALLGCLVLATKLSSEFMEVGEWLTIIARTGVKLIIMFIAIIALILAFKGYVTPGGGFQGGSAFAIIPLLILAAFSCKYLENLGYRVNKAEALRSLGLLAIAAIAVLPFIFLSAYFLQNQPKPWIPIGIPHVITFIYTGGTILFYNLAELVVVSMEFTAIFIVLTLLRGEEHGGH